MTSRPASVLIVLLGAIGDVARALPLAVRIKSQWPDTRITWAVEPAACSLVERHPAVDRVVRFERGGGVLAYRDFVRRLRDERYDIALDMQRHFKSGCTAFLSRAGRTIGFHRHNSREGNWLFHREHIPPVDHYLPKTEQFQLFGDRLGLERGPTLDFGLAADPADVGSWQARFQSDQPRAPVVGFLLGSTWPSRIWPVEHYVVLARSLHRSSGCRMVLIGGKGDAEMAKSVAAGLDGVPFVDLTGRTTLAELPAVFSAMDLAVGSDSGPMHIASAVGLPVISLWGPTSPRRSAPFGNEGRVMQSAVGCAPCYRRRCPGLDTVCLERIDPAAVAVLAESVLESEPCVGGHKER